ncbi:MAG: ABC transporter permease [Bacilli bacterium]|nr:ABC transporter permease [Bacilli bacterium]
MVQLFKNLYDYRELLKTNVKKEIRGKYKGAWLGVFWSLLNPILLLVVYSIIFPYILRIQIPNYTMYLCVALLPWTCFTSTIQQGTYAVVVNGNIIKKVYFPREILPISVVTSGVVNFLITSLVMFGFLIFGGLGLTPYALLFPIILLLQFIIMIGITFILSAVTVYVRDLEHLVGLGLMVLFYGTPIVYTMDSIPAKLAWILNLNPMTHIITAYRDILYYQQMPNWINLGILALVGVALFIVGYYIFKRLERNFAEEF